MKSVHSVESVAGAAGVEISVAGAAGVEISVAGAAGVEISVAGAAGVEMRGRRAAPMKIALVCDWFHPRLGGIELHLRDLAIELQTRGNEVVVITTTAGPDVVDGIRVRRIHGLRAPYFDFLISPRGIDAIGRALDEERVDVAHCHVSIVSPVALGGARVAQLRQIPTVVTFHSVVPQMRMLARAAGFALGSARWPVSYSAVSQRVARDVQPFAGSHPVSILANGIHGSFWRVEAATPTTSQLRLVSVMRLNAKKRPLALVGIMQRLETLLPPGSATLRVIGDGPQRERLAHLIASRGLADRITLLGRLSRDEIRAQLANSDVFVLPSVRESFGLAALEARCAGLPVVAMRASGVSELIAHGHEGLLASSDDEFAHHIATLARDDQLRRDIAAHNQRTTSPFDWAHVTEAHLALYRDAIARRATV